MKAILDNFIKISDTEFNLKKTMQFAKVQLDDDGNIKTVDYQDKQNIEINDILTYQDKDYEILDINADNFNMLKVTVKSIVQEQDVPDKSDFIPRKMSPRKSKPIPIQPNVTKEPIRTVPKISITIPKEEKISKPEDISITPKKRNLIKRIASWVSSKLSSYSNS